MYACTEFGYRAIADARDLAEGETLHDVVPEQLLRLLASNEGRLRRNGLLRESDWTQVPDSPLPALERSAWTVYRQALRDLPDVPGFPDCQWPTPPDLGQDDADESGGHL